MNFNEQFLKAYTKRLEFYKDLGEKTFAQMDERDFFFQPSAESNSIAIIVQHMHGNMRSRFTNFLLEDGEKPWRKRDEEFEAAKQTKDGILSLWNEGWLCVFDTVKSLQPDDLMKNISLRGEAVAVHDALLRYHDHYAYHVGQIVFIGKMIKDETWKTLSIPKRKGEFDAQTKPLK